MSLGNDKEDGEDFVPFTFDITQEIMIERWEGWLKEEWYRDMLRQALT